MRDLNTFCIGEIKLGNDNKPVLTETFTDYNIDFHKGILWQVYTKLNLKEYLEFINDPKHMINPPEALMFDNKFFEFFSKTPWYVIVLVWVPVILLNLYWNYSEINNDFTLLMVCYFFGIFLWTLIEYCLHRFLFHIDEGLPDNSFCFTAHFLVHGIHHAFPMDK